MAYGGSKAKLQWGLDYEPWNAESVFIAGRWLS